MDGYAVRAADLAAGGGTLACVGEIRAGDEWPGEVLPGTCVAIMTGAALPSGADAVVPIESTHIRSEGEEKGVPGGGQVVFPTGTMPGMFVSHCGEDAAAGAELLPPGALLGPAACGLLALCGRIEVRVYSRPTVALLSTGNEIVPVETMPSPVQVRDANRTIMAAMLRAHGFETLTDLGIARDRPDELRGAIAAGLEHDALLLSGGVSMGVSDIVPDLLTEFGVACVVRGVAVKPGKPLWAGFAPSGCAVLAMPGNPLAVLVHCSEMAVPLLRRMSGHPAPVLPTVAAVLEDAVPVKGDRMLVQPAIVRPAVAPDSGFLAQPLAIHGSGDLVTAAQANGLVFLPADRPRWEPGSIVAARLWW